MTPKDLRITQAKTLIIRFIRISMNLIDLRWRSSTMTMRSFTAIPANNVRRHKTCGKDVQVYQRKSKSFDVFTRLSGAL